jgi:hypothetical protein
MERTLQFLIKCRKRILTTVLLATFCSTTSAATFTVTTTADAGAGSLRQAILNANALAGTDNIVFNIGTGTQTITLLSSVNVTTSMHINGTTQPGYSGTPLINIGGASVFNINSVNTGTLSSLGFVPNTSSFAILVSSCSNWLFVNNKATGADVALLLLGTNTTHTITSNNFSGSADGVYMNGGLNNGHIVNNNNLSNCTNTSLTYSVGTPASISSNTFTGCNNAIYLNGATNFTLSAPGSGGPNENVFGTGITGVQINLDACNNANVSGFNFSSYAAAPLSSRSPFFISSCSNGTFTNNIAIGMNFAMQLQGTNTTNTITSNNFSGSVYGILMWGGPNNGHTINSNNLSNCTTGSLHYDSGTPASISSNTFTGCNNAIYLDGATNFTLSAPGSGGPNENVFGTGITGYQIYLAQCNNTNVSGFNFSSHAATPLNSRSPFLIYACSNGTFTNNIATGMNIAMRLREANTTHTITSNNFSGSVYGIFMDGGLNNGHIVNNNNLSNCTNTSLTYSVGTPASISSNTFTGCNNAIYLKGAPNFTLSAPGSGGPNENVFGTGITGNQIKLDSCNNANVSGFNFSSYAAAPLSSRSPFVISSCSNGTFTNNIAIGMNFAMRLQGTNTTHTITSNNFSGSVYGIYMNGASNNGHIVNNNNLSNCTNTSLTYSVGLPASISSNTFTGCNNAIYLNGAPNFTLSAPGSGGPNENVFGTGITGVQINLDACNNANVSGFNFSSCAAAPLNSRSPFVITSSSNGTFTNNIATGMSRAMQINGTNATHTITSNNFSGSAYGIYMDGGSNNGHIVNNNNLSNCSNTSIRYSVGTPASINTNTFTGSVNALYLKGANTFTLGSSNVFKNQTGTSINLDACSAVDVSNNTLNGTGGNGILVNQSNNCVINGNTTCGRAFGIRIQGASNANTISNGSIVSCGTGIQLVNTSVNNTTITGVNLFNTTNITNGGANTVMTGTTSTNTSPIISVNSGAYCTGGSFTMTPSGATTYSYTGGLAIVSPTTTTSYSVVGLDANGCVSAIPAVSNVSVNPLPTVSVNSGTICSGQSFTMTPSGASTYTFSSGSSIVTPTANTSYDVTGTSALGCVSSNTAAASVTVNTLPVVSVSSGSICAGQSYTIIANGASTYTSIPSIAGLVVTPTSTTNYSVTGTDANGCVSSSAAVSTVVVNSLPTISVNSGSICAGQSFTMVPSGAVTYTYSNGSNVAAPTSDATYSVSGTDVNGCVSNVDAVASVTVNALPTVTVNSGVICAGQSFTMVPAGADTYTYSNGISVATPSAHATYSVSGTNTLTGCVSNIDAVSTVTVNALPMISVNSGSICAGQSFTMVPTGADTYTYSNGSSVATPTTNATYSVSGTDANGCVSNVDAVSSVIVNALPTISVNSGAICAGQSFTMTPSGAFTYTYSNGSSVATPTTNATYSVSGTDASGCVSNADAVSTVTVNALPTISVNSGVICTGQSFTMVPTGASTYTYSNGSSIVTPTVNATYSVSGTDANGCVSNVDAVSFLTVNALPVVSVSSGAICAGESYTISATGALTYTSVPALASEVVTPTTTTSYTITGTDNNGCVSTNLAVSTVTVNSLPTISVNSGAICAGQSFTMVPTGAVTFTYSNGSSVATPTANATYSVNGTDANGCVSNVDAVSSVTVNALPTVLAVTNNTLLCTGETATLTVSGAFTYTWSTTDNTTDVAVSPTVQTTYTVDGTDANGCVNSTTITQDVSLCTGVVTLSNSNSAINVYPNPNNGLFVIELTSASKVTVTNALGQVVIAETFEAGKHNLDIHNEATGVYFVKVIENNKQQIIKVIKE